MRAYLHRFDLSVKAEATPATSNPPAHETRPFTRLTNGFSKKVENLAHAVSLHYMYYNFGRTHQTLQMTPAMAAGVADHKWSLREIAGLLN
jgi:hypothetical protein